MASTFQTASRCAFWLLFATSAWFALTPGDSGDGPLGWDKANHGVAFGLLAVSLRWAWPLQRAWTAAAWLLAWGSFIELAQTQIPGRTGSFADLAADALGIAGGLVLAKFLQHRRPRLTP